MHKAPLYIHLSSNDLFLIRVYPSSNWERGRNTPWSPEVTIPGHFHVKGQVRVSAQPDLFVLAMRRGLSQTQIKSVSSTWADKPRIHAVLFIVQSESLWLPDRKPISLEKHMCKVCESRPKTMEELG